MSKPREFALKVLERASQPGDFLERWLHGAEGARDLEGPDRALARELACGVIRWQTTLDWLIQKKTDAREQHPIVRDILRLGIYQLFWLDRIPPHAAVDESVELARIRGLDRQCGFINAVLRGMHRGRSDIMLELERLKESDPATGWSHPAWMVGRWKERYPATDMRAMLACNNTPPPTFARVNTLRTRPEALVQRWQAEGVEVSPFRRDWFAEGLVWEVKSHPPLEVLPSFRDGEFYIQDPSTLLAVSLLDAKPGEVCLDLCAAPGGKTTYLAQCMEDRGTILAHDKHAARLELVRENLARLRIQSVTVVPGLPPAREFDRILVDAPCSNTGVIRRRVQSRWRLKPEELVKLPAEQLALLKQVAGRVKRGGTLVYSTCSLEPEENRLLVGDFISRYPGFQIEVERELLPGRDGVDGAYVAKLRRNR